MCVQTIVDVSEVAAGIDVDLGDPIQNYLDVEKIGVAYEVLYKRVHSKAWHDMFNLRTKRQGKSKDESKLDAGAYAEKHVKRWDALVRAIFA